MWASMMVYRMRAHEQWLNRCKEEGGKVDDGAFQSTSRAIRPRFNEAYASASAHIRQFFSQWSALCTECHLTRLWVHWVTVTNHWQEVGWRKKGRHLADETTALRILQLKHCRSMSLDVRSGKH